jgi:hypothetical protein
VNRAKGGCASVHPLHGPELRALRSLQGASPYVFVTRCDEFKYRRYDWHLTEAQHSKKSLRVTPGVNNGSFDRTARQSRYRTSPAESREGGAKMRIGSASMTGRPDDRCTCGHAKNVKGRSLLSARRRR